MLNKKIGFFLILSGALFFIFGGIQLTNFAHVHEPNSYVIEMSTLNSLIENDDYLKIKLQKESVSAKNKIKNVLSSCSKSSIALLVISLLQIICGLVVAKESDRVPLSQKRKGV
jgi:hypothetical protein